MNETPIALGILLLFITCFCVGFLLGGAKAGSNMQKQIIENNCGYHDPKTGEFTWGGLK